MKNKGSVCMGGVLLKGEKMNLHSLKRQKEWIKKIHFGIKSYVIEQVDVVMWFASGGLCGEIG